MDSSLQTRGDELKPLYDGQWLSLIPTVFLALALWRAHISGIVYVCSYIWCFWLST